MRAMRPRDIALAALTSVAWGLAFAMTKIGLQGFSPAELTALRFLIACVPALFVPRPRIPWSMLLLIGLTLFTGQFLLLFFAFAAGMPPGLASVSQQMQAFFTVLLAALFLDELPTRRGVAAMAIAFAGLALIASTIGTDLPAAALGLALAAAFSWAIGNVLVKRLAGAPIFPLVIWCSLVPPLPALLLSNLYDHDNLVVALASAPWQSVAAALYLGIVATIFGYAAWGHLLQRHPAGAVAPFALLAPCVGVVASAILFGEGFSPLRLAGMALVLGGLALVVLPAVCLPRFVLGRS